ncbi:MAG: putative hydrolase of the superfamily [Actinomycetota bacterium]|nr:putative hydrolase of the superfamily [Actinomycetota bacterium]
MTGASVGLVDVVVCPALDLPPGAMRRVDVAGRSVCVGNDGGVLFAVADTCLHKGLSLSDGMLRNGHVTCPGHWWRYDVHTGALAEHHGVAVSTYPVQINGGDVVVTVPPAEPKLSWRETLLRHAHAGDDSTDAGDGAPVNGVRGVIWDMGGIVYPTPFEVFDQIERAHGLAPGALPRGPFAPKGDSLYDAVDAGELPEPEYWAIRQSEWQARGVDVDVHRDIDWTDRERADVIALLDRLGPHLPQLVLTNDATAFLGAGWRDTWSLRHHFTGLVDSVDLGVRKPEPRAYEAAAAAIGLPMGECLFIDDLTVNVVASRRAGMPAERFDVTDVPGSLARIAAATGM